MLHLQTIIGNRDINIEHKLCKNDTVLQIIATRAVQAFLIVLQNEKFTIPSNVQAETKRYFMESSNTILQSIFRLLFRE